MDTEEKIIAAQKLDPVMAARIARSITDIERDFHLASGPVSDRLMNEIIRVFTNSAVEPWLVAETDGSALLIAPEWKMTKGVGIGDAWLELSEISLDEQDHTWLAAAVKAGGTMLCIELMFRTGLRDTAQAIIRDDKAVSALWKLAFVREEQDARLFIPIDILAELVAQAFEQNDFDQALTPVGEAVARAIAAKAELDKLIEQVRAAAKRK